MEIIKYKVNLVREDSFSYNNVAMQDPYKVYKFATEVLNLHNEAEEVLSVFALDIKGKVIGIFEVSRGSLNASIVSIREIFKRLLLVNASKFILTHNHPSGDESPSHNDIITTKRIKDAGEVMGIDLLDHIIIGEDKYYSFLENKIM